jgi:hypothetical protein
MTRETSSSGTLSVCSRRTSTAKTTNKTVSNARLAMTGRACRRTGDDVRETTCVDMVFTPSGTAGN